MLVLVHSITLYEAIIFVRKHLNYQKNYFLLIYYMRAQKNKWFLTVVYSYFFFILRPCYPSNAWPSFFYPASSNAALLFLWGVSGGTIDRALCRVCFLPFGPILSAPYVRMWRDIKIQAMRDFSFCLPVWLAQCLMRIRNSRIADKTVRCSPRNPQRGQHLVANLRRKNA